MYTTGLWTYKDLFDCERFKKRQQRQDFKGCLQEKITMDKEAGGGLHVFRKELGYMKGI